MGIPCSEIAAENEELQGGKSDLEAAGEAPMGELDRSDGQQAQFLIGL